MPQPNDLSRSAIPFEYDASVAVVIEMSLSSWLIAGTVPGVERQPLKKIVPDAPEVLRILHRWRDEATRAGRTITRIAVAFEAGRDGFWLARYLTAARDRGSRHPFEQCRGLSRTQAGQDGSAGYSHADAGVSGMAARRTRPLRNGRGPDDRARGCQTAEP